MLAALPPRLRAEVVRKLLAQAWLMARLRLVPATAGAGAPVQSAPQEDWDGLVAERLGDAVL
jgi:hypothetical protein